MNQYDVIIIGGGIQGAGIAQVFAVNNYRVLLLEQYEVASQTSSRSSKLIHGGLRYLESFQFSLVRECLKEREILLRIAPDLVRLVPFHIPVYDHSTRSAAKIRAGLSLYALLGGLGQTVRFRSVARDSWDQLDGLQTRGLEKVFSYFDAQTDDRALTRAVCDSAVRHSAELQEHAAFLHGEVTAKGVSVVYSKDGHEKKSRCRGSGECGWTLGEFSTAEF